MRALLTLLLLRANELVTKERLIDMLWGDEAPARAANSVQVYVSRLRKLLGPEALVSRPGGYLLSVAPEQFDLQRFLRLVDEAERAALGVAAERLRTALELWRGDPLADLAGEEFAWAEIRRLEELRVAVIERRIEVELALGVPSLTAELEVLVRLHPLRERLRAGLMLALYRDGRQSEALQVYRDTRRLLADELGLEPGEHLRRLEQAILVHDPALRSSNAQRPHAQAPAAVLVIDNRGAGVELGALLAFPGSGRDLVVARLVAPGQPVELERTTKSLGRMLERLDGQHCLARVAAFSSPDPAADAARLATQQDAALVLIDCADRHEALVRGWWFGALNCVTCDVGLVVGRLRAGLADGAVLVPFGAAFHDWAALELGAWLARSSGRPLRLVGAVGSEDGGGRDASRLLADASLIVQRCAGIVAEPLLAKPGVDGILEATAKASCLIVPLSERWQAEGLGAVRSEIASRVRVPTVFVCRGSRPGGLAPADSRTRFSWSLAAD